MVVVIDFLGNVEVFFGVEVEFFFELFDVVSFEGSIVDIVGVLLFGVEIDDGFELDKCGFVFDFLGFFEGVEDVFEVVVIVFDGDGMLVVRFVFFEDVFGESLVGVVVDGDVVVVLDGNEVVELEMVGERVGFGGDIFY